MKPIKRVAVLATALMIFGFQGMGQIRVTVSQIELIEKSYQLCLDKGTNGLSCSIEYYYSVDSCLSGGYSSLMETLNSPQKAVLEKEQYLWLKKRNSKFKLIDKVNTMDGKDGQMIRQSEKADFIKARALELIGRINN